MSRLPQQSWVIPKQVGTRHPEKKKLKQVTLTLALALTLTLTLPLTLTLTLTLTRGQGWAKLNAAEKAAAKVLGHTDKTWDNASEKQPASANKYWAELSTCGEFVPSSRLRHTSN